MSVAALVAGSPLVTAQRDPRPLVDHRRVPGFAEMTSIFDFEPVFHGNVPQAVYDYTAHAADSEFTIRRNRDAFDWVDVVPRAPIDSAAVDTGTTVLGLNLDDAFAVDLAVAHAVIPSLSASFRMRTICVSLNFDFRMTAPDAKQSLSPVNLSAKLTGRLRASVRFINPASRRRLPAKHRRTSGDALR